MRCLRFLPTILVLPLSAVAIPSLNESPCNVVSESLIGKEKNVKLIHLSCERLPQNDDELMERAPPDPVLNVCGTNCTTNCFRPSGGGPDPNECHVIADALRYESQHTGAIFQVQNGTVPGNPVIMLYRSCKTFFVNQDLGPLAYCRTNWADLVDYVALNCQTPQNAHGGNCVATDQRWFVQVESNTA